MLNSWTKIDERHMECKTDLGSMWIRLNRDGKVTGMYTMFGTTEKHVPNEEWQEDPIGAQLELDRLYNIEKKARQWSKELTDKTSV